TYIYTLSLHDALPISNERRRILFGDAERLKQLFADYGIPPTDVRYSIFNKFFCIQLKIYINFYFLYFKSSIRSFSSFLRKDHKRSEERRVGKECRSCM